MKFLQKILLVTMMVAVTAWNTDVSGMLPAAPVDFPNLPGVVVPNYIGRVQVFAGPNGDFVRFNLTNAALVPVIIFIPTNGVQPSTQDAIRLSQANTDPNNIASPITDWYVRMFGGPSIIGAALGNQLIGFDATAGGAAVTIVTVNAATLEQRTRFWNVFRIIAANPVGRLLLYRILIEIRRTAGGNGVCEAGILLLPDRNFNRCISINWGNSLAFNFGHAAAPAANGSIVFNDNLLYINSVYSRCALGNCHRVDRNACPPAVGLFHEMSHWFHLLRAPQRMVRECKAYMVAGWVGGPVIPPVNLLGSGNMETIGSFFWGTLNQNDANNSKFSAVPWVENKQINTALGTRAQVINFEEIRNILGAPILARYRQIVPINPAIPVANHFQYYEGDDLSENSFRVSLGLPIRLGHTSILFHEDYRVVNKALEISGGTKQQNLLKEQKGLGNFKIRNYNDYVIHNFFAN
jgi:hypothetical protein